MLAVCQHYGWEAPDDLVPRIAFGFGGGIGNSGAVCGAVCGAVMALGMSRGPTETMEEALGELALSGEFRRRFEAVMGTINCRELTSMDLSTPEGIERFMESDTPLRVCFPAVNTAYRLVTELIDERE